MDAHDYPVISLKEGEKRQQGNSGKGGPGRMAKAIERPCRTLKDDAPECGGDEAENEYRQADGKLPSGRHFRE